jgi:hypothetical protein
MTRKQIGDLHPKSLGEYRAKPAHEA